MEPMWEGVRLLSVAIKVDVKLNRPRFSDFEHFYRMSWHSTFRVLAATLGDVELAVEAVDEAMVRAFTRWQNLQHAENPEGWVYRVAFRWSVDRLRRRRREAVVVQRVGTPHLVEDHLVEPGLDDALDALSLEQRAVVVLACAFDWSEAEIAEVLGIRPGTVKSRLSRGLAILRKEIGA